ncbi:MAG: isoprenylcysteine carboxylmethyltransferase family protein [Rhodomicrobiaceae bacterium]
MENHVIASLGRRASRATLKFLLALAAMIFLPAWSLSYWQGWLFLANVTVWSIVITLYLLKRDPGLLERRLYAGPKAEEEPAQKRIQFFMAIQVIALVVTSAFDHGLGFSAVSAGVVIAAELLIAIGYLAVLLVFRENSFASATIELAADQRVISSGPYALVRHPMYAAALVIFVGVPLSLGSWWGLLLVPPLTWLIAARLLDEERYLIKNLPGYDDYRSKVRYRLVPGVW